MNQSTMRERGVVSSRPQLSSIKVVLTLLFIVYVVGVVWPLQARPLVFAEISDNPKRDYKKMAPLAAYVAHRMADLGITGSQVVMAKDLQQMVAYLRDGKVDWVTDTVFPALVMQQQAGAEILARRWKKGVAGYHTVFFTRKESPIRNLSDLVGHRIAFEEASSTSAFLLPMAHLIQGHRMTLTPLKTFRSTVSKEKVGFFFAGGEINLAMAVFRKQAAAGAFSNGDWEAAASMPLAMKRNLRIFARTQSLPRALELVRKGLDAKIRRRLLEVLLTAHDTPEGRKVLHAFSRTKRFDGITDAIRQQIKQARAFLPVVQKVQTP
ncbi:MAG: phosphate/phosphite/phosphonate ABC transporter substrate-binding protein [Magnetococcales bacterium]|nr:phosphate/phosphite/phosphonate ABC transporter substrate-binding protein [Magnetococcales bacterium]